MRLLTFETFDQSDEKTWPDQQKDNGEDKYKRQRQWQIHLENTFKERSLKLLTFETFDQSDEKHNLTNKKTTTKTNTKTMTNTFREHLQRAMFETFYLWDTFAIFCDVLKSEPLFCNRTIQEKFPFQPFIAPNDKELSIIGIDPDCRVIY